MACNKEEKIQPKDENPLKVYTQTVLASEKSHLSFSGEVSASQSSTLKTKQAGYVKEIVVSVGDEVLKNQILIKIDNEELNAKHKQAKARIAQAQSNYKIAQKDLERFKRLRKSNSISEKELEKMLLQHESAQTELESAKQTLNQINAMMNYTQIRAPFSGKISSKVIQEGDMAMPGIPLLSITSSEKLEIISNVSESQITQLSKNQSVKIIIPSLEKTFNGKISEVSNSSSRNAGQYYIKAIFNNQSTEVLSGMYAKIVVENTKTSPKNQSLFIPKSALIEKNGLKGVYVVGKNKTAVLRWLKIGSENTDLIEVLSGLNTKDKIITKADGKIYNGKTIQE